MGYDCNNHLPKGTKTPEVLEFLELLGYQSMENSSRKVTWVGKTMYYFSERDFESRSGIMATLSIKTNKEVIVHTHTQLSCSSHDTVTMNLTIRQLMKRFGGYFISDFGKGKYIRFEGVERTKAEAGCFRSFSHFRFGLFKLKNYLMTRDFKGDQWKTTGQIDILDEINPAILANNIVVPYLVSCIEEFFESSFIALLKYSSKRQQVFKSVRLTGDQLQVASESGQIEFGIARALSFQNLSNVASHFKLLDDRLDIAAVLRKPYRRRKKTLFDTIQELVDRRNEFIHSNRADISYSTKRLEGDARDLEAGVTRVYRSIAQHYGWVYDPDS